MNPLASDNTRSMYCRLAQYMRHVLRGSDNSCSMYCRSESGSTIHAACIVALSQGDLHNTCSMYCHRVSQGHFLGRWTRYHMAISSFYSFIDRIQVTDQPNFSSFWNYTFACYILQQLRLWIKIKLLFYFWNYTSTCYIINIHMFNIS